MIYIKLDENLNLSITKREPIYRGENLSKKITFLIPLTVGEIDILTAYVYLSYIRADGIPDIITLERLSEKYNESYYQYVLPISCKLAKFPGEVCTWLQIYTGVPSNPIIAKSGECLLYVENSKNMDDYLCDHQLSAIYALQKATDDQFETVQAALGQKADNMIYDEEENTLQLCANGNPVGDAIDMSKISSHDDVIHFGSGSDTESGNETDNDDVIYF